MVAEVPRNAQKKDSFNAILRALSGKRDSTPRFARAFLANYIYTPNPWEGRVGSLRASHSLREYKMKKDSLKLSFSF